MKSKIAIILAILLSLSTLHMFKTAEKIHEKHIEILNERIELLEEIIIDYETIDALNIELEQIKVAQDDYDSLDQKWLEWVSQNMWICEVDWGE